MIKTTEHFDITFIDASRLSTIGRCEARFLFKCLMGLKMPGESMLALDYGTVMHKVLPLMYNGETEPAINLFNDLWSKFPYGEEDKKRNTSVTRERILDFVLSHAPGQCPYEILSFPFSAPTELISENEVPFLIDIGAEIPFVGRMDAIVKWKATKDIWCYDFKTSSEISQRYFESFWLSPQAVGYTLAAREVTGEKIQGIVIEPMRISEKNIEHQQGFVYCTEHNIRTFLDETKLTLARMNAANEFGQWRQNHALCASYSSFGFPCKTCEYKLLCDMGDNWEAGARFFERRKPFNPLDVIEEGE